MELQHLLPLILFLCKLFNVNYCMPIKCNFEPGSESASCTILSMQSEISWQPEKSGAQHTDPDLPNDPHGGDGSDWYVYLKSGPNTKKSDVAVIQTANIIAEDEAKCLTFFHYNFGTKLAKLELIRECSDKTSLEDAIGSTVLWRTNGRSSEDEIWVKETVRLHSTGKALDQCVLLFRAEALGDTSLHGAVVLADIVSNNCEKYIQKPGICDWDAPCQSWSVPIGESQTTWPNTTTPIKWEITQARHLPSNKIDHTKHSPEGNVMAMRINGNDGCFSARLLSSSTLVPLKPSNCLSFYARSFKAAVESRIRSAEIFVHIVNASDTGTVIDTPWSGRLGVSGEAWSRMHAYIDLSYVMGRYAPLDRSYSFKLLLEARICTNLDGGIAIDDLKNYAESDETCRLTGDEHFDEANDLFWQTSHIDLTGRNWVTIDNQYKGSAMQIANDHTMMDKPPYGAAFVSEKMSGEVSRFESGTILAPTLSRCISFWLYGSSSTATAYLQPISVSDDETTPTGLDQVWSSSTYAIERNDYALASFWYSTKYYHKIVFEAMGGIAVDDFTFTDGACSCKPPTTAFCKHSFYNAPTMHNFISEIESYYSRVGDCPPEIPAMIGGTFYDVTLQQCERSCTQKSNCKSFIYDSKTRNCELKSVNCPRLVSTALDKVVYQRKVLPKYFDQPGECRNDTPIAMWPEKPSVEKCADMCDILDHCAAFVYAPITKECWLHQRRCDLKEANDRQMYEMVEFRNYLRYSGKCDGQGESTTQEMTRRQCSYSCETDQECTAFTYDDTKRKCTVWHDKSCATKRYPTFNQFTYVKIADQAFSCDFETMGGGCDAWEINNDDKDDFDLVKVTSMEGYGLNGPRRDATLNQNGEGHYLLATFRDTTHGIGKASIAIPGVPTKTARCLTFHYYMYGPSIGRINVRSAISMSTHLDIWSKEGSMEDKWREARISLEEMPTSEDIYQLTIEVALSKNYYGAIALDDLKITPHSCMPTPIETCNFEGYDSCQPVEMTNFANYAGINYHPAIKDVTYGTKNGHVMGTVTSLATQPALFRIKHIGNAKHERCVLFWYKRGSPCVGLTVSLTTSDGFTTNRQFVTEDFKGADWPEEDVNIWTKATVTLPAADDSSTIDFYTETLWSDCKPHLFWMVIDEIIVLEHGCQRKSQCDFEMPTCTFSSDSSLTTSTSNMPWLFGRIPVLSRFPAPEQDNSLGMKERGAFAIVEQVLHGDLSGTAELVSFWIAGTKQASTTSFFYMLSGPESGLLEVFVLPYSDKLQGEDPTLVWHLSIYQKTDYLLWKFGRFYVAEFDEPYQVIFRGTRGVNSHSILAIDDVVVTDGMLSSVYPSYASPSVPITTPQPFGTTTPGTPYPPITLPPVFECDFEQPGSLGCGFVSSESLRAWQLTCQSCNDTDDVKIGGPIDDHTTRNGNGHYWYLSMNDATSSGISMIELFKQLKLPSTMRAADSYFCLSFWYYVDGTSVTYLGSGYRPYWAKDTYWKRAGNQGPQWNYFEYTLRIDQAKNYTLFFLTERSKKNDGFVAVDDVSLYVGQCPKRKYECTFDEPNGDKEPCDSSNAVSDPDAKWVFKTSSMSKPDHTMQTEKGLYASVEPKSTWLNSFTIQFKQPYQLPTVTGFYCLRYWYKTKTNSLGTIQAYLVMPDGTKTLLSTAIENGGTFWSMAEADVTLAGQPSGTFSLLLEAEYHYKTYSSRPYIMAVDDIRLEPHTCKAISTEICTFEEGLCGWRNADEKREFDWLLGSGANGGPIATDNTYKIAEGHYMYLPLLAPRQRGDRGRFISPVHGVNDTGCLSFSHYILAQNPDRGTLSSLRVIARTEDGEVQLWSSNILTLAWTPSFVPIDITQFGLSYEIIFEGTFDSFEYGDTIAIDDVGFNSSWKGCLLSPSYADPTLSRAQRTDCDFSQDFCYWLPRPTNQSFEKQWTVAKSPIDGIPAATFELHSSIAQTTSLSSRQIYSLTASYCFGFEYAFHGEMTGTFSLAMQSGDWPSLITRWQRNDNQGYRFNGVFIPVKSKYDLTLSFNLAPPDFPGVTNPYWSTSVSVRNVMLIPGRCPDYLSHSEFDCNFEDDMCKWQTDSPKNFKRTNAYSVPPGAIAPADHTTQTGYGYYMYATYDDQSGEEVKIKTSMKTSGDQCMFFWYYLTSLAGSTTKPLISAYVNYTGGPIVNVWNSNEASTNLQWRLAVAPIPRKAPYDKAEFHISATMVNGAFTMVDDIRILVGECPHPVACTFEDGQCGYVNEVDRQKNEIVTWKWTAPASLDLVEGPSTDHTTNAISGHFLLIDAATMKVDNNQKKVIARSNIVPDNEASKKCVQMWYQLKDRYMKLTVKLVLKEGSSTVTESVTVPTNDSWTELLISADEIGMEWYLHLEADLIADETVQSPTGYVAIDDITFYPTNCYTLGSTTTLPTTTVGPVKGFSCNFDTDFCTWDHDAIVDYMFKRGSGRISSSFGPSSDHTTGFGYYAYLNSEIGSVNGSARLVSQVVTVPSSEKYCFNFWYHMTGLRLGSLLVKTTKDNSVLWTRTGDQGNKWIQGFIELERDLVFSQKLMIEATRLNGDRGVIAFDDTSLVPSRCPATTECTFEDDDLCGWFNDPTSKSNWVRVIGRNANTYQPPSDHTYSSSNGAYIHYGGQNLNFDGATLLSPEYRLDPETTKGCLRLWVWGAKLPASPVLAVLMVPTDNGIDLPEKEVMLTIIDAYPFPTWRRLSVNIEASTTFRIKIGAGSVSEGGLAVDDVEVDLKAPCGRHAFCDFEKGECGWHNTPQTFYWEQHRGPTETPGTGPSVDHTLNSALGTYMYQESSVGTTYQYWSSTFESELLPSYDFMSDKGIGCFIFWYHMWGSNMGSLLVLDGMQGTIYWNKAGDQGNKWNRGLVDFQRIPLVIHVRGDMKGGGRSDIAIDDVVFMPGSCDQYKEPEKPEVFTCNRTFEDGTNTIPMSKRCDFVPDCPDGDDEVDCGFSCDFDNCDEGCAWEALSTTTEMWLLGTGATAGEAGLGPPDDFTTKTMDGGYMFIGPNPDPKVTKTGYAIHRLHIQPTPETCYLQLYYRGETSSSQFKIDFGITIYTGDGYFDLKRQSFGRELNVQGWARYRVTLGRIHAPFTVAVKARKTQSKGGYFAIDALKLVDCTFPLPNQVQCNSDQFKCANSGACIPKSSVCDVTDDCGDGSDEVNCASQQVLYCNVETSDCGFKVTSGYWARSIGTSSPPRDHTTGLAYGYFFMSDYYHSSGTKPNILRLNRTIYIKEDADCTLRFYYQMKTTVASSSLIVELFPEEAKTPEFDPVIFNLTGQDIQEWTRAEVKIDTTKIKAKSPFTIQFVTRDLNYFAAIDDLTMSPGCFHNSRDICLAPDFYRCKGPPGTEQPCIQSKLIGDFIIDCPYGDDEHGYGPCDFEPDIYGGSSDQFCGWQLSDPDGAFRLKQVTMPGSFEPRTDGPPTLNATGFYMHSHSDRIFSDEPFVFTSPPLPEIAPHCKLNFAFYSNGPSPDETYRIDYHINSSGTIFPTHYAKSKQGWQTVTLILNVLDHKTVPGGGSVFLRFAPSFGSNNQTLGIDNFAFEDCSATRGLPQLNCNFDDKTLCGWSQGERIQFNNYLPWQFGDGSQVGTLNGPGTDFSGNGTYIFISSMMITTGPPLTPYYGQLVSNWYDGSEDTMCLQFAYSIYGPNCGPFYVYLFTGDGYYRSLFTRTRSQGNQWHRGSVTIPPIKQRYYLMFSAYTTRSHDWYIAIDEVVLTRGECIPLPTCDFEDGLCGWSSQAEPNDFTWERTCRYSVQHWHQSGPPIDHTTESNQGFFMNFEGYSRNPGDRAVLKSPPWLVPVGTEAKKCLQFWYHLNGKDIATMTVSVAPSKNRRAMFSRRGHHGNHWWHGMVEISASDFAAPDRSGNFTVSIEGVRGNSVDSDMAIDDAGVGFGPCPKEATCEFERNQCGFSNVYESDDLNWIRNNNATPSPYSGPSTDHTKGDAFGYYMFVNSQSAMKNGSMAYYTSDIVQGSPNGHCFSFWYHMFGKNVGKLSVLLMDPTVNDGKWLVGSPVMWSQNGAASGDRWYQGRFHIYTDKEYAIVFAANLTKTGGNGDIAIDDISLDKTGPCQGLPVTTSTPSPQIFLPCGFEHTNCGFEAADPKSVIAFRVASGAYPVREDAPMYDHTRNDQSGHYYAAFLNGSESSVSGRYLQATAFGPYLFTTRRHCQVMFWYYTSDLINYENVGNVGYLTTETYGDHVFLTLPTSPTRGWRQVTADMGEQKKHFRIFFRFYLNYIYKKPGMIALDDLSFLDCNPSIPEADCSLSHSFHCANLVCVQSSRVCDGTDDCGDGSDEAPERCNGRIVLTFESGTDYMKYVTNVAPSPYDPTDFQWTITVGNAYGSGTGPSFDHTFANSSGRYYRVNPPYGSTIYNKCWLKLAPLSGYWSNSCQLCFFYHMYGSQIGSLNVYYRSEIGGLLTRVWNRTGEVGNVWSRGTIDLNSVKTDYELIFEGVILGTSSQIAIDDISLSEGCVLLNATLPTIVTTTTTTNTPPPCESDPEQFSCGKGQGCIPQTLVCNFVKDCPDGSDEKPPRCVANPGLFGISLEADGWQSKTTTKYKWERIDVSNIPEPCTGACPTMDADGSGFYAIANSQSAKYNYETTRLASVNISSTGPQCKIWFSYAVYSKTGASGTLELSLVNTNGSKRLWSVMATGSRDWRDAGVFIGKQTKQFYLEFTATAAYNFYYPAMSAVDNFFFDGCQTPEPKVDCTHLGDWKCPRSGACINAFTEVCDFADHCADGTATLPPSDEDLNYCRNYVARCAFDEPAASCTDWFHDSGDLPWRVSQVINVPNPGYPPADHTLGTNLGHILILQFGYDQQQKVARYTSSQRYVVTRSSDICAIRFYLYLYGFVTSDVPIGTVSIFIRTSYVPLVERSVANFTANYGAGLWTQVSYIIRPGIDAELNRPFEFIIHGKTGNTPYSQAIAVDDISLTPECHATAELLPGQRDVTTTTHAPKCSDTPGLYQCANGVGCYSIAQHCNFMSDCQDGSDEIGCTQNYCDFDGENHGNSTYWCDWKDVCSGPGGSCPDGVQWKWSWWNKRVIPSDMAAPATDYTSNSTGGGYLISSGGHTYNDRAILTSSHFQDASPECTLQFAYYAYIYPSYEKPSKLNIHVKSSSGRRRVHQIVADKTPVWNVTSISVYSKEKFQIELEVIRGSGQYGDISIDALELYNCTPTIPATNCPNPTDFLCRDASRCIEEAHLCDYTPDCRDGSDEEESFCMTKRSRGSCTFENPNNWQTVCSLNGTILGEDLLSWNVEEVAKINHGPLVDHTLQNRQGHAAYVDLMKADFSILETATLVTTATFPPNEAGSCLVRFYYFMYRAKTSRGSGRLKVVTVDENGANPVSLAIYSLASLPPGTSTQEIHDKSWLSANVKASRLERFRVEIQVEGDDNGLSVFAVDDVSLSEGCRTGSDQSGNATQCRPKEVFCESEKTCLPLGLLCDGWCDCPSTRPDEKCVDEADELCILVTTTTTPEVETTSEATTGSPGEISTTTGQSPDTPGPVTGESSIKTTTQGSGTTLEPENVTLGPDAGLVIGAVIGSLGTILLVGVGIFLTYRYKFASNLEPVASVTNPVFGDTAIPSSSNDVTFAAVSNQAT